MKIRLGIFIFLLLALPLAGLLLSGAEWDEPFIGLGARSRAGADNPAPLFTAFILLAYVWLINQIIKWRSGHNPIYIQRAYFFWMFVASAVLGWLMVYLNLFAENWSAERGLSAAQLFFDTVLFALVAPAVLSTRALIGAFPGLLKRLAHRVAVPVVSGETLVFFLAPLAVLGLLGGAVWPGQLFWLLWLAPLLLLVALQLLWHESTIFSGLKSGDWGRVVCAMLAGMIVANLSIASYKANGGSLTSHLPSPLFAQLGYALFGLLCLQLGDVIAENWRGKKRSQLFRQKKKFPVPVVKKN